MMLLELSGIQSMVIGWIIPAAIGMVLAYVPLMIVIKNLKRLLDTIIEANADGKVTDKEYDEICQQTKELTASFVSLLKLIFQKGKVK